MTGTNNEERFFKTEFAKKIAFQEHNVHLS